MHRGISNVAGLVASMVIKQQTKAIEHDGGMWVEKPNREQRRRMEQEQRRQAKKGGQHGTE